MRSGFDKQLAQLNNAIIEMGTMVENAIADANQALIEQDVELAKKVIAHDDDIDAKEKEIEAMYLRIILRQHPVAGDLRMVSSVSKITTDLERIGDHASDISEIAIFLAGKPYIKEFIHIPKMAEATVKMVTESIDAFVKKDLKMAQAVIEYDDVVDDLFLTVRRDLIRLVRAGSENGEQAMDLLMVAKYFERIGDHAVNIAEWVVFSITGKHVKQ